MGDRKAFKFSFAREVPVTVFRVEQDLAVRQEVETAWRVVGPNGINEGVNLRCLATEPGVYRRVHFLDDASTWEWTKCIEALPA
jgi:hypothetical protein